MHGYSAYNARYAHVGQVFSQMGYDYYCLDQRGHGKSGGHTGLITHLDDITNDQIEFQLKVLNKYYDMNNLPPIYFLAHSMGCAYAMEILVRQQQALAHLGEKKVSLPDVKLPPLYTSVCFCNPFFSFYNRLLCKYIGKPFVKVRYAFNKKSTWPEVKYNDSEVPAHMVPWLYDFENPYQRGFTPMHSVLEMARIMSRAEERLEEVAYCWDCMRNSCSDMTHNVYGRIQTSLMIIIGTQDDVVDNELTKKIFMAMDLGKGKDQELKLVELNDLDHTPFSNAK